MCKERYMMFGMHNLHCHYGRNFLTKEEKMEHLKEYKNWLEKEKKGVEEKIEELNKAS